MRGIESIPGSCWAFKITWEVVASPPHPPHLRISPVFMFNSCNLLHGGLKAFQLCGGAHEPFVILGALRAHAVPLFTIYDLHAAGGNKTRWLDAPAALGFLKKSSHSHISDRPASTPIIYETERDWEAQPDNRVRMRLGRGRLCKTNVRVVSVFLVMVQITFHRTKEKNAF